MRAACRVIFSSFVRERATGHIFRGRPLLPLIHPYREATLPPFVVAPRKEETPVSPPSSATRGALLFNAAYISNSTLSRWPSASLLSIRDCRRSPRISFSFSRGREGEKGIRDKGNREGIRRTRIDGPFAKGFCKMLPRYERYEPSESCILPWVYIWILRRRYKVGVGGGIRWLGIAIRS